jgi:hypothetical protein
MTMPEFMNTADVIGDDALCDLLIMGTVTEYNENRITKVGGNAFIHCTELTTVDIPEVVTIGWGAFTGCPKLTSVNAPNASSIEKKAFFKCIALEKVCFPALIELDGNPGDGNNGALGRNTALKYVDLPVCTKILGYSLNDNPSLTTLILRNDAQVCTLQNINAFTNTPISAGTGYIYVPRALLSDEDATKDYRRATNWSTYANQFRAIEDYTVDGTVTGELDASKL